MTVQEKLSAMQHERTNNRANAGVYVCEHASVLTVAEFIDSVDPAAMAEGNREDILDCIQPTDRFVKLETIGKGGNEKPYLINGKRVYVPFYYDDFEQFRERVVFEKGFAEAFGIFLVARPDLGQVVDKLNGKKSK